MQQQYQSAHSNTAPKFLRIGDVMELTALSKSYLYELAARGDFPKSIPIVPGGTARGWLLSEVEAWMGQRIADRDREAGNE